MPLRNLLLLVFCTAVSLAAWAAGDRGIHGRRFGEVLTLIQRSALDPVDGDTLLNAAVEAAVAQLDEHSAFLPPAEQADLEAQLDQRFGGVGLQLAVDERSGLPLVVAPVAGSPADRAGIGPGDLIVAIDNAATGRSALRDAVQRLRGSQGTTVTVRVVPASAAPRSFDPASDPGADPGARDVVLVREPVKMESVLGDRRRADGSWEWEVVPGVALVRITSFGEHTATDLATALASIERQPGLRGLVLDLRGNPGGLLSAAVEVCDQLLDEGVIVATRGRRSATGEAAVLDTRRAERGAAVAGVPVAVLIDGLSASAAEIVAACLQDNRRATIVGSRSFGKGTVQTLLPLADDRGMLKLTTSEYLRPNAGTIHRRSGDGDEHGWGVQPDAGFEVTPTAAALSRLRRWREARDMPPGRHGSSQAAAAAAAAPAEVDEVLAVALEIFTAQHRGEERISWAPPRHVPRELTTGRTLSLALLRAESVRGCPCP
jgi:carboxyl-terminal processing protease